MSLSLGLPEYDSWICQKQGLSLRSVTLLGAINRTLFGHGVCTLSGPELGRRSGLQSRNRLRAMWDLVAAGIIEAEKEVTRGGITRFVIRRIPITARQLIQFAINRWGKGLDNDLTVRREGRLLPGFHESMFAADVGSVLRVRGDSRDDISIGWDDQSGAPLKVTKKQGVKKPSRRIGRRPPAGSVGSNTVKHQKKRKTETDGPTRERGARAPASRSSSSSLGERQLGNGGTSEAASNGAAARHEDTLGAAAESRFSSIERWMAQIEVFIIGNPEKDAPAVTPPSPRETLDRPEEPATSHPDLVTLQALVLSLAANPDDVKPLPTSTKMEKKLLRVVKRLGGVEKSAKFLTYAMEQGVEWVFNFNWRDLDVYLLLCSGARKEWLAATTKPSALKSTSKRSMSSAAIRNRKMRRDEWIEDGDDPEVGW